MTPEEHTQQQAVLTVAHGDYQKGLNLYASFKLNDRALGENLVQDTFMKTWAYLVKGGKVHLMKAFLYHVLNTLIIDEYRKRKHAATSLNELLERGFEPASGDSARLYVQGLTIKEMSLITGQSRNAIAVQAYRGLAKIKVLYDSPRE